MRIVRDPRTKLCHLKPGDTVRLLSSKLQPKEEVYVVAVFNEPGRRAARPLMSHGLYDDERPLFLVNLDTGEAIRMPHLSSLVLPAHGVFVECDDRAVVEAVRGEVDDSRSEADKVVEELLRWNDGAGKNDSEEWLERVLNADRRYSKTGMSGLQ